MHSTRDREKASIITFDENPHTDAQRRRRRLNVVRVLVVNHPPARYDAFSVSIAIFARSSSASGAPSSSARQQGHREEALD